MQWSLIGSYSQSEFSYAGNNRKLSETKIRYLYKLNYSKYNLLLKKSIVGLKGLFSTWKPTLSLYSKAKQNKNSAACQ